MNMMYGSNHNGYCCGNLCEIELVSSLEGSLQNSTWFHRNKGLDHLIVLSHFKIHDNMDCVDSPVSISESQLKELVSRIREIEKIFGDGFMGITPAEKDIVPFRRFS